MTLAFSILDTHGGIGRKKPKENERRALFGLWTTDTFSVANERTYLADLNSYYPYLHAGRCTMILELTNGTTALPSILFAILAYMNFEENAVLYIDGCNGMTPDANSFRNL